MLEIRYYVDTFKLTAWCRDETAFGNLDRGRENEAITVVDFNPDKPMNAYLFDRKKATLVIDPKWVEPLPPRDLASELDDLKIRLTTLEKI